MKLTNVVVAAAAAQVVSGHYFWNRNIIDGKETTDNQYIRKFSREIWYNPTKFRSNPTKDVYDNAFIDTEDGRCNKGGTVAGDTQVLTIAGGSKVTFKLGVKATMKHPGPLLAYMQKADGSVQDSDGSGDWFKIHEEGVCDKSKDFTTDAWCSWDKDTIEVTIPKDTPDGEYLIRAEHIGIHRSHVNQPEHFMSCMQVKVTGGGTGTPGPTVKFPGAYKDTDPYAKISVYNGYQDFVMPGPALWTGGAGSGSGSGSSEPVASAPGNGVPTNSGNAPVNPVNPVNAAPTTMSTSTTKGAAAATPVPDPNPGPSCEEDDE